MTVNHVADSKDSVELCHACGQSQVNPVPGFFELRRVTSDSKPWTRGGRLGVCAACGLVQKVVDARWTAEVDEIYGNYTVYHQGGGAEQSVFTQDAGTAARSERILQCLAAAVPLPEAARLLDIGCGNGALLRAAARCFPRWGFAGTELTDQCRAEVEAIHGMEGLYTSPPEQVPGTFHLITMVHVLEHIPAPAQFLERLAFKLAPGGILLLEVPDHRRNPFDLLIADHCSHFGTASAAGIVESAGYELVTIAEDWVPKESTLVARRALGKKPPSRDAESNSLAAVADQVAWLTSTAAAARRLSGAGTLGIFGTSIAATWLFAEMAGAIDFFLDEDPNRAGLTYMERPVYHPRDMPDGSRVLMALPPSLSKQVRDRLILSYPGRTFVPLPQGPGEEGFSPDARRAPSQQIRPEPT